MCINEDCDHPEGMLDRDLRTTRSFDKRIIEDGSDPDAKCSRLRSIKSVQRTRLRSCSTCSFRNLCHHLRKSFHKLKQAVTVLLCLSYAVGVPTTSSLPVTRTPRGTMATPVQNPALKQLESIKNTANHNAYQANKYFNETYVQVEANHAVISTFNNDNYNNFFFKHTSVDFKFPNNLIFNPSLEGVTFQVNEFTKIFYDCFMRFNGTMDKIGEKNYVRDKLKVLLEELEEYILLENIEPLEKYAENEMENLFNNTTSKTDVWKRNMITYRDFAKTMEYVKMAYEYFYNLAKNAEASQ